jgi:hypothetical protein
MRGLTPVYIPLLLIVGAGPLLGQDVRPVAKWSFDEISEGKVTDDVSGARDAVEGYRGSAAGVAGRALQLDGYTTRVVRTKDAVPAIAGGLTVDAWVALATYPWNEAPVVAHTDAHRAGYFFAINARGGLVLRVLVDGRWRTAESPDYAISLRRWTHVAATYDRVAGLTLYVDGKAAGRLAVDGGPYRGGRGLTGNVQAARGADLLIGMDEQKRQPTDWHRDKGTQPAWYSLDGLLDELRIFAAALDAKQIATAAAAYGHPADPALAPRVMPSGPPGPGRFGAYYTRLGYYDAWEALWQVGPHPDVLVRFDRSPARLVFWRGTQYGPAWVSENNLWMADQSVEGYDRDLTWEHMNDKHNRYSHVRIVEQSDARVVVHWRYAPVNVLNQLWNVDQKTRNGTWIDEYYYVYPDAMGVRQVTWRADRMASPVQFQESIPLTHPGQLQGDVVNPDYVTVGNLRGETQVFSYMENPPAEGSRPAPDQPTIQMYNLKSQQKPFIVFEPGNKMGYLRDMDIRALSRAGSANHWPVAQIPSDGRTSQAADRASHFLGFPISTPVRHKGDDGREWWNALYGMTDKPFSALVGLARSWSQPPGLRVTGGPFTAVGYRRAERAYVFKRDRAAASAGLAIELAASGESPARNLALVVENWDSRGATVKIDGKIVPRGPRFRYGLRRTFSGTDLIAFLELEADRRVAIALAPGDER